MNKEVEAAILESERRICSPPKEKHKVDLESMHTIVKTGIASSDPKITQAATLALLQFKAFLRISEAKDLLTRDIYQGVDNTFFIFIKRSKTDQTSRGFKVPFKLSQTERQLWEKY